MKKMNFPTTNSRHLSFEPKMAGWTRMCAGIWSGHLRSFAFKVGHRTGWGPSKPALTEIVTEPALSQLTFAPLSVLKGHS